MNNKEKLRSDSLNILRFPLAVVVLIIHTFSESSFTIKGVEYDFNTFPLLKLVNNFINGFLSGQSVPVYFFISGYVFFLNITFTKEVYKKKLQNRTKTLLIPFLIWNLMALLLLFFKRMCLPSLFPAIAEMEINYSFSAFLYTFWDASHGIIPTEPSVTNVIYPQNLPLWFLRDLMIVVLCTPIICYLLKHIRQYFVLLLGVSWFVLGFRDLGHANQLLSAFSFFSWGAYISISNKDMLSEFGRYSKLSVVLYISFSMLYVVATCCQPELRLIFKRFNIIFGLFFFYNFAAWLLKHKICKPNAFLASASFFIYVSHTLVCGPMLKILFLVFTPSSDLGILSVYISTVLLVVCVLLGLFYILHHYFPYLLKVITGRK